MLINFRVKNFLSFMDEVEFTALATLERQHRERVFSSASLGLKVLPVAAFFGGNGSGKSNLFKALKYARYMVLQSSPKPEDGTEREPFRLHSDCLQAPSEFGFDILLEDQVYRYAFSVTDKFIESESLSFLNGDRERTIFKRERQSGQDGWTSTSFDILKLPKEDREFLGFKTRDTLPNQLFLAAIRGRKIPVLETVANWFRTRLVLLDPQSEFRAVEVGLLRADNFKSYCVESLVRAGTGISHIQTTPVDLDSIPMDEESKAKMLKHLEAGKDDGILLLRGPSRSRFIVRRQAGAIEVFRITTDHQGVDGGKVSFELSSESDGTERLIDLLPAFYELTSAETDRVFFIDELDRSLHTHLTRGLIESYLATRTSASRTQLFFTTHDPLLLDQDLLRRDEVWFLDKQENGHSKLTALSDFKGVRYDKNIRKNYLLGRFAGVPAMRSLPRRVEEVVSPK